MKKVIFILITFVLGFLVFSSKVLAYNSDATATCIYPLPSNDYVRMVTFKYAKGEVSVEKATKPFTGVIPSSTDTKVMSSFFISADRSKIVCPNLYYYFRYYSTVQLLDSEFKIYYMAGDMFGRYVIMVLDKDFRDELTPEQEKGAQIITLTPSLESTIDQGKIPATDSGDYLVCKCGDVTIENGKVKFQGKYSAYDQTYPNGFNPTKLTSCPETLYYRKYIVGTTIEVSNSNFEPMRGRDSKVENASCATGADIVKYSETTKNPTDYVPQEDVIKPFCEETIKVWKIVGYLVGAIKVMVPAIIIVLGSIDLGKAVVAQSEDDIKKGTQLLIKRLIAGIIIFFIPTIVMIVLKMASKYSSTVSGSSTCIECVSKPGSC